MRIAIGILILLSSCKTLQKSIDEVKNNTAATEEVIADYVKKNPQRNDTTIIRGITTIRDSLVIDTIPLPVPIPYKIVERNYRSEERVDSAIIKDRELLRAVANRLQVVENELTKVKAERDEFKHTAQIRLYWLLGLISLIVGGGVMYVLKVLKPSVTIQRP